MEEIAAAIGAVALGLVQGAIHLVAGVLSASFFVSRRKGWERAFYVLTLIIAAYLLFGLARGFFEALAGPVTAVFYGPLGVLIAFVLLFVSIIAPFAMRDQSTDAATRKSDGNTVILSYVLAIALIFGGIAFWIETARVPIMEERHCTSLLEGLPDEWADRWRSLTAQLTTRLPDLPDLPAGLGLRIERCTDIAPD